MLCHGSFNKPSLANNEKIMLDIIKKSMLAGIGAAEVTREAAEKSLKQLVDQGKITTDEAGKLVDNIVEEGRQEYERNRGDLNKFTEEILQKGNLVTQSQLTALEARVAALEKKNAAKKTTAKKTTAKKAASKKGKSTKS